MMVFIVSFLFPTGRMGAVKFQRLRKVLACNFRLWTVITTAASWKVRCQISIRPHQFRSVYTYCFRQALPF